MFGYLGIALAYAAGLDDHQVEPGRLADIDALLHVFRQRQIGLTGGQRAHVDPRMVDGVHADAVAQKRAAAAPP